MINIVNRENLRKTNFDDIFYDYLVVGVGLAGAVMAERLATAGKKILMIDKRNHIGGNCYDYYDINGVLIHKYGPHLFRTNEEKVYRYIIKFSKWFPYLHRVWSKVDGKFYEFPINRNTINKFFNKNFTTEEECREFLDQIRDGSIKNPRNLEEKIISMVGRMLYEKFYKGYTRKQWGKDPKDLPPTIVDRIDVRCNDDDSYHPNYKYRLMPEDGYTKFFERMLSGKNIKIILGLNFKYLSKHIRYKRLIYTGPIDEFLDYRFGKLPYRSLRFKLERYNQEFNQKICVYNFPNNYRFTRRIEIKHATGQKINKTTIVKEYPESKGEPYYLIPSKEGETLYSKYLKELKKIYGRDVLLVGRLAEYRYYSMDQVIGQALELFEKEENE